MLYKCKKELCVQKYDEDGFLIENEFFTVQKDSIWEQDVHQMLIGGKEHVHLDNVKNTQWIEITFDILEECFEPLNLDLTKTGAAVAELKVVTRNKRRQRNE